MTLSKRCSHAFDPQTRNRGLDYFQAGEVDIFDADPKGLVANVRGSNGNSYEVTLDWKTGRKNDLTVFCSCPRYQDGYLCKHLWATILAADAYGLAEVPGKGRLEVIDDWDRRDDADDFDDVEDFNGRGGASVFAKLAGAAAPLSYLRQLVASPKSKSRTRKTKSKAKAKKARPPQWLKMLKTFPLSRSNYQDRDQDWQGLPTKRRIVWYALNVGGSQACESIRVRLYCRETRRSGEWGTIKRLTVRAGEVVPNADADDQRLLQLLLGANELESDTYSPYYYGYRPGLTECHVQPAFYDVLLPRLCASGRFTWILEREELPDEQRLLAWDDGRAWRFRVRCTADPKRSAWQFSGELYRGQETVDLKTPVLVLASGLVVFPDRIARLESAQVRWIDMLRQVESLEVPFADRSSFLQAWWDLPNVPEVELPPDLCCEQIRSAPQGKLTVLPPTSQGKASQLPAKVAVLYGDKEVDPRSPQAGILEPEQNRVIVRDREREASLLERLGELGVRRAERYGAQSGLEIPAKALSDLVAQLAAEGWIVEAEGRRIRRPGQFNLSVTSSVDWFELQGEFDFDGVTAKLPALLAALRKGQKCVLLGDGSQGMLPEEWLKQYGALADLGEADGDSVRFRPSQGALLDALLAAQPNVDFDAGFQEFREKLRAFAGIAPSDPPAEFQGKLREYQKEGLSWLHFLREFRFGGCLADDMGLGKTVQVLGLLEARRTRELSRGEKRRPSLVVVPRSLVYNWIEEAARFTPRLRVLDYTGLERAGKLDRLEDYDLLITTYGTLRRDIVQLKDVHFDYAVLDESQAIKNSQSQSAKACRLLTADHRLAMTGTPVENHLGELWSLFEFLNPGFLGRSAAFSAVAKNGRNGHADSLQVLAQALRPFLLRRTKEQVLRELPEKTEQTLYCEMKQEQRAYYDELRDYYRASLTQRIEETGLEKSKIHVLEALLRLRQAACHPGLIDRAKQAYASAKLETLLEQVKEIVDGGHKALIFSQFTSLLAIVRERLDEAQLTYEYLDGRTRKRGDKVRRFQEDPNCPLFLISLKAGGHGLNLTAADYVFILDPWWNPAVEAQAVDRAHRIGQTRRVFAYRLICRDTVEEKILQLQKDKQDLAAAIISADNSLISKLTAEDLELLLS